MSGEEGIANWTPVAKALARLQTGPTERSPIAYQAGSASRPASIGSAPSICRTATGGAPSASAASTSSIPRATVSSPARSSAKRRPAAAAASAAATSWATGSASGSAKGLPPKAPALRAPLPPAKR